MELLSANDNHQKAFLTGFDFLLVTKTNRKEKSNTEGRQVTGEGRGSGY